MKQDGRRIYLARHGETDWNARRWVQGKTDTELNAVGIEQARRLGETLARLRPPIVHVYSSRMRRAHGTGRIVAERLRVPTETREGLQELNLGDWEGHTWRQIERGWPEAYAEWNADKRENRPPSGESYRELLDRMIPAMLRIAKEAKGDVLVVTHSGCLMAFLAELNETPLERMGKDYATPNAEVIAVSCARILARWQSFPESEK